MEGPLQQPPSRADRMAAVEKEVRAWGRVTRSQLIGQILSLNLEGRALAEIARRNKERDEDEPEEKPLIETINYHIKKSAGEIDAVSIRFAKHGIFLERGVGKGRKANSTAANLASNPWLAPILPRAIESLADHLAEGYADVIAAEATIRIPGVIETTIRK